MMMSASRTIAAWHEDMGRRVLTLLRASASSGVIPLMKMAPPTTAMPMVESMTGSGALGCLRKEAPWSMSAVESAEWARLVAPVR